ncbi:MAG: hypothetical protein MTP17_00060 [Candidatus Midichloria sp.]|nr:MAG: hypothetical protein MTP17_00060 [Candidatus Midichloria sp.]
MNTFIAVQDFEQIIEAVHRTVEELMAVANAAEVLQKSNCTKTFESSGSSCSWFRLMTTFKFVGVWG